MRLDVALTPADLTSPEQRVCIVVDALRATSSIAVLLGRGAARLVVAATVDAARELHQRLPDALLCGESGGLPPEGFHHGNSPLEFQSADLAGRTIVLATSNGTRALSALGAAKAVFTGSLLNLSACARAAIAAAAPGDTVTVVCAGNHFGTRFSLEDTGVAGAIVEKLARLAGPLPHEEGGESDPLSLSDAATAAYRLWRSYPSPRMLFGEAEHGQSLAAIGMERDLDLCSLIDQYDVAPRLSIDEDGLLVLTAS